MNGKDWLEFALAVCGLIAVVYRLAQVERRIYDEIDNIKDIIFHRINVYETRLEVHLQDYANRKESVDYRLGGLEEKIKHVKERLLEEIKQVQRFLEKQFSFRTKGREEE